MEKPLICFHICTTCECTFYLFNFSSSNGNEEDYWNRIVHGPYGLGRTVLPPLLKPEELGTNHYTCNLVALGSNVYFTKHPCKQLDTSNPELGWREFAHLEEEEHDDIFSTVAVDNKIFCMEYFHTLRRFDPVENSWSAVTQPPSHIKSWSYWSVLEDEKTIVFMVGAKRHERSMLYGYNVGTDSWVLFEENFEEKSEGIPDDLAAVAVNRCLYWISGGGLTCYDLDDKAFYSGRFEYLDLELRGITRRPGDHDKQHLSIKKEDNAVLTSLGGGKLCMIWQHDQLAGPYTDPLIDPNVMDSSFCCVYAIKFQASKVIGGSKDGQPERTLKFSIDSSKSFLVKKSASTNIIALAVDGDSTSKEETIEKKSKKPMLPRDSQPPSIEKSICFRTINCKGISNFYMFSFSYDEDVKAIDDHHYQIIHGRYGFGRALLHPLVSGFKKNRESYREDLIFKECYHEEHGAHSLLVDYKIRRESNCAALGYTVYCFGGYVKTNKVHCLNIQNPSDDRIKQVPSMIKHRFHPQIHTSEGKIYVMGGLHEDDTSEPWMEMFDPQVNEWTGLASNPYINGTAGSLFISAFFDSKTLLVSHQGKHDMHAYDIATDSWRVYDDQFDYDDYPLVRIAARIPDSVNNSMNIWDYPVCSKAVTFEKTWYQYDCNDGIVAYDMEVKKWFRGELLRSHLELRGLLSQPLDAQLLSNFDPVLLHVGGGKLCLLWHDRRACGPYTDEPDSTYRCVYWIKFRVSKLIGFDGEGVLNINIDLSKSFLIDGSMALRSATVV